MKCQREHDWIGKTEHDIEFKYIWRTPVFQVCPYLYASLLLSGIISCYPMWRWQFCQPKTFLSPVWSLKAQSEQRKIKFRGGPFDFWWGGWPNPKKTIEHMFLVKKKILAEFLRRKKKSSSLINLGVAKDFAWCVMAPKVAVSHMIQDWASHFLMRELVFCKRDAWFTN